MLNVNQPTNKIHDGDVEDWVLLAQVCQAYRSLSDAFMEEAGVVTRHRDVDDNRLVRVYLTAAGKEKERAITEQFLKLQGTVFDGIDERNRVLLRQLLQKMLQNMTAKS